MKGILPLFFSVLLFGVPVFAQKQKTSPDAEQTKPPVRQNKKNADSNEQLLLQSGTSIEAQLQQTLDVKSAAVGDRIVLTTTRAVKQNGRTVVKKGSRLIGRVTEVQQKTKESAQAKLGVVFERLEGQDLSAPISATIVAITRADAGASVGDTLDAGLSGESSTAGRVSRGGGSGGGLLGGVTNTVGSVVNTTSTTLGGVTNTAGRTVNGTSGALGSTLSGIRLSQSTDAAATGSTTLSTTNKNLRLEKGVTFQLRLSESVEVN